MNPHTRKLTWIILGALAIGATGCQAIRSRLCRKFCGCEVTTCSTTGEIVLSPMETLADAPATLEDVPEESFIEIPHEPPSGVHPSPPPRGQQADQTPQKVPDKPGLSLKTTPPTQQAGLSLDVSSSPAVAAVGDEITFEITLKNQSNAAIASVDMTATVAGNLDVEAVEPEGTAEISGRTVTFKRFDSFTAGLTMRYRVIAKARTANGGVGRVSVEVNSPILTAGALKAEATSRIGQ